MQVPAGARRGRSWISTHRSGRKSVSRPLPGLSEYPVGCFGSRSDANIRSDRGGTFCIASVDPNRFAARARAGIDVPPSISDEEAATKVYSILFGSEKHKSWLGLSAIARVLVIVVTGENIIQRQCRFKKGIHFFD